MPNIAVVKDRYTIEDPLYQWDYNKTLEIRGLSLPSIPEIHFTNQAMERAIVRQAEMNDAGIITVSVPNSLLQKPYDITVYVCIYKCETFESLYKIVVPVTPRKQPADYSFTDDEEIYSYNALDNKIDNTLALVLARYDDVNAKYEQVNLKYEQVDARYEEACNTLDAAAETLDTATTQATTALNQATQNMNEAKTAYKDTVNIIDECETATSECQQIIEDAREGLGSKENKATIVAGTLSASGWSNGVYSFETTYPVATYNLEIALNNTATAEQAEAYNGAQIVGSATANQIKAYGDVPAVDIPIIIKAVKK